jgi:hypothetical protein
VFACDKCSSDKIAEIIAVPILTVHQMQQRLTAAKIQYFHLFRRFMHEGVHV